MTARRAICLSAEQAKTLDDFARETLRRMPSEPILPLCLCGRWHRRTRPCVPPMPWPERTLTAGIPAPIASDGR